MKSEMNKPQAEGAERGSHKPFSWAVVLYCKIEKKIEKFDIYFSVCLNCIIEG